MQDSSARVEFKLYVNLANLDKGKIMAGILTMIYGSVAYLAGFLTLLYAIGFVGDFAVPKTINTGNAGDITSSMIINLVVLTLFALQHSIMARPAFKKWWAQFVP